MKLKEFDIMLDIKKSKKIEYIEVVQGDYGTNIFNIHLRDGEKKYDLNETKVEIVFSKSDRTTVMQGEENGVEIINPEEGKITCTLNTNTIAAIGRVATEVRVSDLEGKILTTAVFSFFVRKPIIDDETIKSTNEFPILYKLINDVDGMTETVPIIERKLSEITDTESELNKSIVEGNQLKIDLPPIIDNANTSKTNLETTVNNANTKKTELDNSITTANTTKGKLDASISSGNTIKTNLDTSINNSTTAKTSLDNSVSTANTTKTALDGSVVEGNALKGELDQIISGTDYENITTDIANLKQDQHNHINKGTLDGLSDVSGKLKYNGQDVGIGDMEKSVYDIDGDGKVDVANNSEKLGGQLPSYYAKQSDVNNKVDKVTGKQLSTEDYTTTEKNKLTGIATNATKNDTDANLKSRANHTGTQLASTISDFANTVRATVLTGLSFANNTVISVTDTVLSALGKLQKQISDNLSTLTNHINNKSNPHSVTKTQIDLGNVDNTSDLNKPISTATQTALNGKVDNSRVLTDVPLNADFTDTVTTINDKTGEISKADIVALGIPSQDTIYNHPSTHPASMITESSTKRFVSDTKISEWDGKETTTGSQAKANQAEQNAKDYTDQEISSIDIPDSTWESIQNKPDTFVPSEHNHTIGNITDLQNELNSKETPSGSQSKANVAESNAKSYVDGKVLTDVPSNAKFTDTIYTHPPTHPASMITDLPTGKKVARFVVGTSTSGWTTADCDYLCDGTADQVEINNAITALPATGGEIVILDGTYNITAKIDVTKDNVSIRGNGNATILKRMFNSSVAEGIIMLTNRSGCKIADLQVDGNRAIYDAGDNYGIYLSNSSNNTVTSNTCNNNKSYGIYLYSSSDNKVTGNTCNNSHGIYLSNSSNNTVTSNTCNNNHHGIHLRNSSNNNTVTGNTCNNNNSSGIYVVSNNNNTVTGNTCYNNNSFGIYVVSNNNNTVTGNTCTRGTGLPTDYTESQHTIYLIGTGNNYNLISNNNCMGKAPMVDGGTGNSVYGNKYDSGDYKDFTQDEKTKLAGISDEANNYSHPDSHPASMITQDANNRFVSDAEKSTWSGKSNFSGDYNDLSNKPTIQDTSNLMPISGGVLENYREKLVSLSGTSTAINLSLGNVFTHSLTGDTTYTISNAVNGQAHSFTLIITQTATVRTLTFPASVKWQGGEIPDLTTASKTYILTFMTVDGGTAWLGMFGGEF